MYQGSNKGKILPKIFQFVTDMVNIIFSFLLFIEDMYDYSSGSQITGIIWAIW